MTERASTAIVPTGDPASDRINAIDSLADLIYHDDRFDQPGLTWSDCWNAARVAHDSGWRRVSENGS